MCLCVPRTSLHVTPLINDTYALWSLPHVASNVARLPRSAIDSAFGTIGSSPSRIAALHGAHSGWRVSNELIARGVSTAAFGRVMRRGGGSGSGVTCTTLPVLLLANLSQLLIRWQG